MICGFLLVPASSVSPGVRWRRLLHPGCTSSCVDRCCNDGRSHAGSVQSLGKVAEGRESAMGGRGSLLLMLLLVGGTLRMVLLITWHARAIMDKAQAELEKFMQFRDPEAGGGSTVDLATLYSTGARTPPVGGVTERSTPEFQMSSVAT